MANKADPVIYNECEETVQDQIPTPNPPGSNVLDWNERMLRVLETVSNEMGNVSRSLQEMHSNLSNSMKNMHEGFCRQQFETNSQLIQQQKELMLDFTKSLSDHKESMSLDTGTAHEASGKSSHISNTSECLPHETASYPLSSTPKPAADLPPLQPVLDTIHRWENTPHRRTNRTPYGIQTDTAYNPPSWLNQSGKADFPRQKLPTYDGTSDWASFMMPFERAARRCGWPEEEKLDRFVECLRGQAIKYLSALPPQVMNNFNELKRQMENRFDRKEPPTTARKRLADLRQKHESNEQFAEEVRRLVTLAYPTVGMELQEELAAEAFLKGYKRPKTAYEALGRQPKTIAAALDIVTQLEHNYRATVERDAESSRKFRRVSWNEEVDDEKPTTAAFMVRSDSTLKEEIRELRKLLERSLQTTRPCDTGEERQRAPPDSWHRASRSPSPRNTTVVGGIEKGGCFNCGNKTHYIRDCPQQRQRSPSPSRNDKKPVFKIGNVKSGRSIVVPVGINGVKTECIVDTGADITVLATNFAENIGLRYGDAERANLLNAQDGREMEAVMNISVDLELGDCRINWPICIAPIRDDVLIGMDLLEKLDGVILARQEIPVRMVNPTDHCVTLSKGTHLGKLVEAENSPETISQVSPTEDKLPAALQDMIESASANLTSNQQKELAALVSEFRDIFAENDDDLGCFSAVQHQINTGDAAPIRQPARRTPLGFQGEEKQHLDKLLANGTVVPSNSDWASPVVLVRKKDGGVRWCIDYRRMNDVTTKDSYPLPNIEECLDTLAGASIFSTLDLQSGYHQIEMFPEDQKKTAFITRYGLFQYTRMPFGLCGGPSTFQRAMELVFRGLQWDIVLIYLDDVIIGSNGFEEHLKHLSMVFQRFRQFNLKLKPRKCHLFQEKVLFLGHVISGDGVETNAQLTETVRNWPVPSTVKDVQSFLGITNYYRRYIPHYAELAEPLYALLPKGIEFIWSESQQTAFETLKAVLASPPILAFPISDEVFILDTDASNFSIGAVLSQQQGPEERVIGYASKRLGPAQMKYCVTRKELLAVVVFTDKFKHYLLGRKFLLRTDHGSLTWLYRFKSPQGQLARWLEQLSQYDIIFQHRRGKDHNNADAMSRYPSENNYRQDNVHWLEGYSFQEISKEQQEDPILKILHVWAVSGVPKDRKHVLKEDPALRHFWLVWDQVVFKETVAFYKWKGVGQERDLLLVPNSLKKLVLELCHSSILAGHPGIHRTVERVREKCYWYDMRNDVSIFIACCPQCSVSKKQTHPGRARLQDYHAGFPMDRVQLDILGPLPQTRKGNKYILVLIDQFSKWTEAYPLADQTAESVAEVVVKEFICRFGVPLEVHTDQGSNFESSLMGKNPNYTLPPGAYRSTPHTSTGLTPNRLMLGKEIRLPQDIIFGLAEAKNTSPIEYLKELQSSLQESHTMAREFLKRSAETQKCSSRTSGRSPKLQPQWKGPYVVSKVVSPVLYEIADQRNRKVLHHDRLKSCSLESIPGWVSRLRRNLASKDLTTDVSPNVDSQLDSQSHPYGSGTLHPTQTEGNLGELDQESPDGRLSSSPQSEPRTLRPGSHKESRGSDPGVPDLETSSELPANDEIPGEVPVCPVSRRGRPIRIPPRYLD
ncbi:hypothetical protein ScPMuIL_011676 [Solemya velum]